MRFVYYTIFYLRISSGRATARTEQDYVCVGVLHQDFVLERSSVTVSKLWVKFSSCAASVSRKFRNDIRVRDNLK